jgi:hypothetical protein
MILYLGGNMTYLLKKPYVHQSFITNSAIFSPSYNWRKNISHNNSTNWFLKSSLGKKVCIRRGGSSCIRVVMAKGSSSSDNKSHHNVKALVSVKESDGGLIKNIVTGIVGNKHLILELVSAELDPSKSMRLILINCVCIKNYTIDKS